MRSRPGDPNRHKKCTGPAGRRVTELSTTAGYSTETDPDPSEPARRGPFAMRLGTAPDPRPADAGRPAPTQSPRARPPAAGPSAPATAASTSPHPPAARCAPGRRLLAARARERGPLRELAGHGRPPAAHDVPGGPAEEAAPRSPPASPSPGSADGPLPGDLPPPGPRRRGRPGTRCTVVSTAPSRLLPIGVEVPYSPGRPSGRGAFDAPNAIATAASAIAAGLPPRRARSAGRPRRRPWSSIAARRCSLPEAGERLDDHGDEPAVRRADLLPGPVVQLARRDRDDRPVAPDPEQGLLS
ncbi:hypothetical protein SALBM135S_07405 [Streptomyces alboniger]